MERLMLRSYTKTEESEKAIFVQTCTDLYCERDEKYAMQHYSKLRECLVAIVA